MAEREIKVVISAADEYSDAYAKFKSSTKDAEASVTSSASKMEEGWKSSIDGIKSAWVGMVAVVASSAWLKSASADALEAETNLNKLRIQLEGIGKTYNSTVANAVSAAANYARVQDDEVNKTLQELIFISGDADKSLQSLNITYDLAYQKGISASEAASLVGKAMTGNIEPLGRYMLEFKNINEKLGDYATEAEKAAYAMAVLEEKTNGALAQMTEHEKKIKDLTNVYKDLKQGIGEVVLEMAYLVVMDFSIEAQKQKFESLTRSLSVLIDSFRYGTEAVQKMEEEFDNQIKLDAFAERAVTLVGNAHKKTAEEIRAHTKALSDLRKAENDKGKKSSGDTLNSVNQGFFDTHVAAFTKAVEAEQQMADASYAAMLREEAAIESSLEKKRQEAETITALDKLIADGATARANIVGAAYEGLQDQYLSLIETGKFSVSQLSKVVADQVKIELTGIAAKASVQAIFETARGLADLAIGNAAGASMHFAAATEFASVAGLALAGAAATQAVFGGTATESEQGTTTNPTVVTESATDTTSSSSGTSTQNITVNVSTLDPSSVNWERLVEDNIYPAMESVSGRNVNVTVNI